MTDDKKGPAAPGLFHIRLKSRIERDRAFSDALLPLLEKKDRRVKRFYRYRSFFRREVAARARVIQPCQVVPILSHDGESSVASPQYSAGRKRFRLPGVSLSENEPTEVPMQKFRFSLSNTEGRQDGIIDGPSFLAAVDALSERIMVRTGDKLEIGVTGFPPATFECVGEVESFPVWVPANRLAA